MMLRKIIYQESLDDGLGKKFTIKVPITVMDVCRGGQWEEIISCKEWRKVEKAIEKKYPGWHHTCHKTPKQHCKACTRNRATEIKKLDK